MYLEGLGKNASGHSLRRLCLVESLQTIRNKTRLIRLIICTSVVDLDPRIRTSKQWIRIWDQDPAIFILDLQNAKKYYLLKSFSAYYFLKIHLHIKIKSHYEVTKQYL
jgi:hypothetical protein